MNDFMKSLRKIEGEGKIAMEKVNNAFKKIELPDKSLQHILSGLKFKVGTKELVSQVNNVPLRKVMRYFSEGNLDKIVKAMPNKITLTAAQRKSFADIVNQTSEQGRHSMKSDTRRLKKLRPESNIRGISKLNRMSRELVSNVYKGLKNLAKVGVEIARTVGTMKTTEFFIDDAFKDIQTVY
uniref:Alr_0 protein n=1 Tax=Fopius arisanus TaxID=64838 RepID=A0A0C9RQZ3_9HYME